jgi:hypothetical protein
LFGSPPKLSRFCSRAVGLQVVLKQTSAEADKWISIWQCVPGLQRKHPLMGAGLGAGQNTV